MRTFVTVLGCLLLFDPPVVTRATPSISLDHVVLAVNDLDATAARYRQFGFSLKLGRSHANGIVNQHVKFKDGTELELLTVLAAFDDVTTRYRSHLAEGDGPAYLALFPRPAPPPRSDAPSYVFFGQGNHSPTDRPEHFAHRNTADRLMAVWLAGSDFAKERALFSRYRVSSRPGRLQPLDAAAEVFPVLDGLVYLLPERFRVHPARPIVGVTFHVRDRRAAERVLREARVQSRPIRGGVLLEPTLTGGLWMALVDLPPKSNLNE